MDIFLAQKLGKRINISEAFQSRDYDRRRDDRRRDDHYDRHERKSGMQIFWLVINIILAVIFGVIGAWLSWSSNSVIGYHIALKILFAIFAFLFGLMYVIIHLIFKLDLLSAIKKPRYTIQQTVGGWRR
jgi:hypothetical protein